jgi:hypothetical protein
VGHGVRFLSPLNPLIFRVPGKNKDRLTRNLDKNGDGGPNLSVFQRVEHLIRRFISGEVLDRLQGGWTQNDLPCQVLLQGFPGSYPDSGRRLFLVGSCFLSFGMAGNEEVGVEPLRPRFRSDPVGIVMELTEGDEDLLFLGKLEEGY